MTPPQVLKGKLFSLQELITTAATIFFAKNICSKRVCINDNIHVTFSLISEQLEF